MFVRWFLAALVMVGAGLGAGQGFAQEDLNRGKSPAQLYASDCVDCHKNARALGQRENAGKLADFLRVHYTASRESAAAIAQYLVSLGPEPRASRPAATSAKPRPASQEQGKAEQGKSAPAEEPAKAAEKPAEPKPAETAKPAEPAHEKAAPAAAAPPAAEPAPAAAAPASPPADPQ